MSRRTPLSRSAPRLYRDTSRDTGEAAVQLAGPLSLGVRRLSLPYRQAPAPPCRGASPHPCTRPSRRPAGASRSSGGAVGAWEGASGFLAHPGGSAARVTPPRAVGRAAPPCARPGAPRPPPLPRWRGQRRGARGRPRPPALAAPSPSSVTRAYYSVPRCNTLHDVRACMAETTEAARQAAVPRPRRNPLTCQ